MFDPRNPERKIFCPPLVNFVLGIFREIIEIKGVGITISEKVKAYQTIHMDSQGGRHIGGRQHPLMHSIFWRGLEITI